MMAPQILRKGEKLLEFEASRWLTSQVWLSSSEMERLFREIEPCSAYYCGRVLPLLEAHCSIEKVLQIYSDCLNTLQNAGNVSAFRNPLTLAWTRDETALRAVPIREGAVIVKIVKPVLQMQLHTFDISQEEDKVYPMILGSNAIFWGVQFSYPQLFEGGQGPISVFKESAKFPNTILFRSLQKILRHMSFPVVLRAGERRIRTSFRLGKEVNVLPGLKERGIEVER